MYTPHDLPTYCQEVAGISVNQLVEFSGIPRRTIYDWWKNRNRAVKLVIKGIQFELQLPEKENNSFYEYEHSHLKVLFIDQNAVATISKQTFVSCTRVGLDLFVTLHQKKSNHYEDFTYRVPVEENEHVLECLKWDANK